MPDPGEHARQLADAGAELVFVEDGHERARNAMRQRRKMLAQIAPGDILILEGLDRLGTGFDDVLRCFELLVDRGIDVQVLDAGFKSGRNEAYRELLKLLAGTRSALKSDAIRQSRATARVKGGKASGPSLALDPDNWPDIRKKLETGSREAVAAELGVHRQTLWAFRRRMEERDAAASAETAKRRPARTSG